jgi:hypothetical protein
MTAETITSPFIPLVYAVVTGDTITIHAADDWQGEYDAEEVSHLMALLEVAQDPIDDLIEFFDDDFGGWARRVATFFDHNAAQIEARLH